MYDLVDTFWGCLHVPPFTICRHSMALLLGWAWWPCLYNMLIHLDAARWTRDRCWLPRGNIICDVILQWENNRKQRLSNWDNLKRVYKWIHYKEYGQGIRKLQGRIQDSGATSRRVIKLFPMPKFKVCVKGKVTKTWKMKVTKKSSLRGAVNLCWQRQATESLTGRNQTNKCPQLFFLPSCCHLPGLLIDQIQLEGREHSSLLMLSIQITSQGSKQGGEEWEGGSEGTD